MPQCDTNSLPAASGEMDRLIATAARWGLEAGFLGIDGRLEARIQALLDESEKRLFNGFETDRERLLAEIEIAETAWNQAQQVITKYRARYGTAANGERVGWLRRLRNWSWQTRDYRSAIEISRKQAPELRALRLRLAGVEHTRRAANRWREMAAQSLRANFEFQQERAAIARERKEEKNHDDHNSKHFIARRAS